MTGRGIILLALVLTLAACGQRVDGQYVKAVEIVPPGGFPADQDNRQLVTRITEMKVLPASGGSVIRVTGLPPRLGYWDGELVPLNDEKPDENGVLEYEFRISEPWQPQGTGTPYSRRVIVAHFVSDYRLQGVSRIRVLAETNSATSRR